VGAQRVGAQTLNTHDLAACAQVAPGQPQAPPQVQIPEDPLAPAALVAGKTFLVDRPGLTQVGGADWERLGGVSREVLPAGAWDC